jgi:hypothetical protein
MWDKQDFNNYMHHTNMSSGQICGDSFSVEIEKVASNPGFKTFLEIGTWNGLGSTRAFVNGLSKRTDDYAFWSLECNSDKAMSASKLYEKYDKVHILNEVIWNQEPPDFYDVFPQCLSNEMYKRWNEVDIINMKRCNLFLSRDELPPVFDVLLLDGGEFTTYYEFQVLKNRCKILMLDDINTDKCKLIVNELMCDPSWNIIKRENVRNGYLIAERRVPL